MDPETPTSLRALYVRELDARQYRPDGAQGLAVEALDSVRSQLLQRAPPGLLGRLSGRWRRASDPPVRGIYLWGPVGRGKTWLMDLFFDSVPLHAKRRLHFHHFMRDVHKALRRLRGRSDPIDLIAR